MATLSNQNRYSTSGRKARNMISPTADDLLTLDELAAKLKMHPVTVRGLKRRGQIPALRLGHRTLRFEYSSVLDALRKMGTQAHE